MLKLFSTDWKSYLFCNVGICLPKNWFLVRSVIIIDNNEHSKKNLCLVFEFQQKINSQDKIWHKKVNK